MSFGPPPADRYTATRTEFTLRVGDAIAWFLRACSEILQEHGFEPDLAQQAEQFRKARVGELHRYTVPLHFIKDGVVLRVTFCKHDFSIYGTVRKRADNPYDYIRIGACATIEEFVQRANRNIKRVNNARQRSTQPNS